jgi:hypothetical protein
VPDAQPIENQPISAVKTFNLTAFPDRQFRHFGAELLEIPPFLI